MNKTVISEYLGGETKVASKSKGGKIMSNLTSVNNDIIDLIENPLFDILEPLEDKINPAEYKKMASKLDKIEEMRNDLLKFCTDTYKELVSLGNKFSSVDKTSAQYSTFKEVYDCFSKAGLKPLGLGVEKGVVTVTFEKSDQKKISEINKCLETLDITTSKIHWR